MPLLKESFGEGEMVANERDFKHPDAGFRVASSLLFRTECNAPFLSIFGVHTVLSRGLPPGLR
jgi:hypothetical protein